MTPPYLQIAAYLEDEIRSGKLPPQYKLPPTREMAKTFGVAPMTLQRAIDEVKAKGLVIAAAPTGTFVKDSTITARTPPSLVDQLIAAVRETQNLVAQLQTRVGELEAQLDELERERRSGS